MSLGFGELLVLLPLMILIFGFWWARKKSAEQNWEVPLTWFYFYTYFRIPIGLLFTVLIAVVMLESGNFIAAIIELFIIIFAVAVLVGLHKRKLWGWSLNIVYLGLETLSIATSRSEESSIIVRVVLFLFVGAIWFLPNYIYFKKRINLFSNSATPVHRS